MSTLRNIAKGVAWLASLAVIIGLVLSILGAVMPGGRISPANNNCVPNSHGGCDPTKTPTKTRTPTRTHTPTRTPTRTGTPTNTACPGSSCDDVPGKECQHGEHTNNPHCTQTPTNTNTATWTPTNTATNTATNDPGTPTATDSPTVTATGTNPATATHTPTGTSTDSPTVPPTMEKIIRANMRFNMQGPSSRPGWLRAYEVSTGNLLAEWHYSQEYVDSGQFWSDTFEVFLRAAGPEGSWVQVWFTPDAGGGAILLRFIDGHSTPCQGAGWTGFCGSISEGDDKALEVDWP